MEIPSDSEYEQPNKEEKALKSLAWDNLDSQHKSKTDGGDDKVNVDFIAANLTSFRTKG